MDETISQKLNSLYFRKVQKQTGWISQIKILFLALFVIKLGFISSAVFNNGSYAKSKPQLQPERRPIMYTFFSRIDSNNKETGMDDIADEKMLTMWKDEWKSAGWDTMVLNLDHAKLHPRFEEFQRLLRNVPLEGVSGKNRIYNEFCFLRWLAVAIMGGGWMSDYDVFPLPSQNSVSKMQELPNGGKFTVYSLTEKGGGIPCLLSGSADEWDRMASALLNNAMKHTDAVLWSDMFALIDLKDQEINTYIGTIDVIPGQEVLIGRDWKDSDCKRITKDRLAVHFSHSALRFGDPSNFDGANHHPSYRPLVAKNWLTMWSKVYCEHDHPPRQDV